MHQIWDTLSTAKKLYTQYIQVVCEKYHLTHCEIDILLFLANNPQFDCASDIVKHRGIAKSHVSASLKTLEEKHLIQSHYQVNDRRTMHLTLLKDSQSIIQDGRQRQKEFFTFLFQDLSQEDTETFIQCMKTILKTIQGGLS